MSEFKSSVLNCYEGDDHCATCRFLDGSKDYKDLLAVIYNLDAKLAEAETAERRLLEALRMSNDAVEDMLKDIRKQDD